MLFDTVFVHDPIEPFVSQYIPRAFPGEPEVPDDQFPLYLTHVPSRQSGQLPTIISAYYPPRSKAFLTADEAVLARRHRRHPSVLTALTALEDWRDLVEVDAMQLFPALELSHRLTPTIARLGEAQIARTSRLLAVSAPETVLASFNRRGGWATPHWEPAGKAARDNARHSSWVYAREVSIARYLGSLYAASTDFDVSYLLGSDPQVPQVTPNLKALAEVGVPGITNVSIKALAKIRADSDGFAALRALIRTLAASPPFDGNPGDFVIEFEDHVRSEMTRLRGEARSIERGLGAEVLHGLVKLGFQGVVGAAPGLVYGDLLLAGGGAALSALSTAPSVIPTSRPPSRRALHWIHP